jgi:pimeloyl-ACP methyl ester carboxylesterase
MVELGSVTLASGITMEYATEGTGTRVAVFIHGYGDSWYSHHGMLMALPAGWRAYAVSLRGHGESSKPPEGYTVPGHAQDVIAFMAAMGISRAVIIGHSMGSLIAQQIAITRPELVSHLVLIASATTANNDVVQGLKAAVADLTDPMPRQFSHEFQSGTCVNPMGPGMTLERVVDESAKIPAHVWKLEADALIGYRPANHDGADLGRISAPTLIIWGVNDGIFPRAEQERLASLIPGARLLVHETSGHAVNWEFPEWTMGEVARFAG